MPRKSFKRPFFPIIYVRGYAGSQGEVEETVADPYMGFNIGSTKIRQHWKGKPVRHYFESPLVRLMKDHEYHDVYEDGHEQPPGMKLTPRSVFIYRYYDDVSKAFGDEERPDIQEYACGLGEKILELRDRYCDVLKYDPESFRVYLIAHSMGGLICRCFLQNHKLAKSKKKRDEYELARKCVDKVFTYATPHNGIDLRILGNIPGILSINNSRNFNRGTMRKYLDLSANVPKDSVASLDDKFDPDRFFCLVGTNYRDYGVALGGVQEAVGPMSDGLVRISNATVYGPGQGGPDSHKSPRAFVNRSHSGHYGIVNSEGGYQNLTRFLFGDLRVDAVLEIDRITLPPALEKVKHKRDIKASYHFETVLRTRGAWWSLHRRTVNEQSAVFRKYEDFKKSAKKKRYPHLFSAFLSKKAKMKPGRNSLGFSLDLGVLVPQYTVDRRLMFDDHYDGGYIYRDKINLEACEPKGRLKDWTLNYGFDSEMPNQVREKEKAEMRKVDGNYQFRIPISQPNKPGIEATLVLNVTPWNR